MPSTVQLLAGPDEEIADLGKPLLLIRLCVHRRLRFSPGRGRSFRRWGCAVGGVPVLTRAAAGAGKQHDNTQDFQLAPHHNAQRKLPRIFIFCAASTNALWRALSAMARAKAAPTSYLSLRPHFGAAVENDAIRSEGREHRSGPADHRRDADARPSARQRPMRNDRAQAEAPPTSANSPPPAHIPCSPLPAASSSRNADRERAPESLA